VANLVLNGYLQASGDGCGCAGPGQDTATRKLALRCSPAYYQTIIETPTPIRVNTPGLPGDSFVELDVLANLLGIEFLQLRTEGGPFVLCIDAGPAELTSGPLTLPTGFVGGEILSVTFDSLTTINVVFDAADQGLLDVVNRINAACALAGLPTPRCTAVGSTQIKLTAIACGFDPVAPTLASVFIGTTPAQIPFPVTQAFAQGSHLTVQGNFLAEFPQYPDAPRRVEVSGQGSISVLAAGRSSL
jgi:hypothetical protein